MVYLILLPFSVVEHLYVLVHVNDRRRLLSIEVMQGTLW
jgi:hypothetical protein